MAKDPAYLFYSDNFLSGTMFLTNEQCGKYIRLLCAQHLTGHLHEKDMLKICGTKDEDIWRKFIVDAQGMYYNERLENEINKRKKFSESRSNNRLGKVKTKKTKPKKTSKSYDQHMEDGDGIENEIINTIKNAFLIFFENQKFESAWRDFSRMRKEKGKQLTTQAAILILRKVENYAAGNPDVAVKILEQSIENSWQGVFEIKQNKNGTIKKPIATSGGGPGDF
jgi:uncharacterized protein YdaU (DUF1376 family)